MINIQASNIGESDKRELSQKTPVRGTEVEPVHHEDRLKAVEVKSMIIALSKEIKDRNLSGRKASHD